MSWTAAARGRHVEMDLAEVQEYEAGLEKEATVLPGHCPNCSLEYGLARRLTGRREESDLCAMCEAEEGL